MLFPHHRAAPRLALLLLLVCVPLAAAAPRAPQGRPDPAAADADRAEKLYRAGDMKGAVKSFRAALKRRKDDPALWVGLAYALINRGELGEARKALDSALRLDPNRAGAHTGFAYMHILAGRHNQAAEAAQRALQFDPRSINARYLLGQVHLASGAWLKAVEEADAIIKLDERTAVAYLLKAEAMMGLYERGNALLADERRGAYDFGNETVAEAQAAQPGRLRAAADSFEKYLQLNPSAPDAEVLREQVASLRLYAAGGAREMRIYASHELTSKAVIAAKPEPGFTEEARRANVTGIVRLRAVLGFDGRVRNVVVLKRLPYGLTEKAVAAARAIRFKPATVSGLPVSQAVTLEYNFNIY
jgi:TonB family protein